MLRRAQISIPSSELEKLREDCRTTTEEDRGETLGLWTAAFDNGFQADVKVVAGADPDECWNEAVLFNANGSEVAVTEPGEDGPEVLGEWTLVKGGDEYVVKVSERETNPQATKKLKSRLLR